MHDLLHGIWHLERGALFTLRNIAIRPGKTVKEYIRGKRAGHFNIFTILILLIGFLLFLSSHTAKESDDSIIMMGDFNLGNWLEHYLKWILMGFIPWFALGSWLVFRRAHYNFAEHLMVYAYLLAWCVLLEILSYAIDYATSGSLQNITTFLDLAIFVLVFIMLWQVFKPLYTVAGWAWRSLAFVVVNLTTFLLTCIIIIALSRKGNIVIANPDRIHEADSALKAEQAKSKK